jgi:hypothetical protein
MVSRRSAELLSECRYWNQKMRSTLMWGSDRGFFRRKCRSYWALEAVQRHYARERGLAALKNTAHHAAYEQRSSGGSVGPPKAVGKDAAADLEMGPVRLAKRFRGGDKSRGVGSAI